jgi:hypothetical protein
MAATDTIAAIDDYGWLRIIEVEPV